jgi:NTP pyrophosphatase (non-canonical NTP hydrolase)
MLLQGVSMSNVDLNKYKDFVQAVTSDSSNELTKLAARLVELEQWATDNGVPLNLALLLTASIGLSSEGGEFSEIVKKMVFQGKPYNEDVRFHLKRELGDVLWYWVNACRALGYDPNDVVAENVEKLQARYPGGQFDVYHSENRADNDL